VQASSKHISNILASKYLLGYHQRRVRVERIVVNYQIIIYQSSGGKKPFDVWFKKIKETKTKALVLDRLDRLGLGLLGDVKIVGGGVCELRIHCGPGYRLYYAQVDKVILLLLCGGSKATQQKDIEQAHKYLIDFKSRGAVHGTSKKN
jgi:putative addiction module killer protein